MEKSTRVVVYGSSLNLAGVAVSLKADASLEVICVNSNTMTFQQSLDEYMPAAVVFDLSHPSQSMDIRLLKEWPDLLLLGVDPSSDDMLVLFSHTEQAHSVADLIGAVRRKDST